MEKCKECGEINCACKPIDVSLEDYSCPVCGNKINWVKSIQSYSWDRSIILLAECWSGEAFGGNDKRRHLFIIKIPELPKASETVSVKNTKRT